MEVNVAPEQMAFLEKAIYESEGLMCLIRQSMACSEHKLSGEQYKLALDKYLEKNNEAQAAKTALLKMYAPSMAGSDVFFDFANCVIRQRKKAADNAKD
jgi:hypothetical protein